VSGLRGCCHCFSFVFCLFFFGFFYCSIFLYSFVCLFSRSWFVFDRIDKVGAALVAACADERVRADHVLPAFGEVELAAIRMYSAVLKPLADFTTRSEGDVRAEANAEALPYLATLMQQ
jgi:hypothetical protein